MFKNFLKLTGIVLVALLVGGFIWWIGKWILLAAAIAGVFMAGCWIYEKFLKQ